VLTRRPRHYAGRPPPPDQRPRLIGTVVVNGTRWDIYDRRALSSHEWMSIKVCARGPHPRKGNYHLGWSRYDAKFSFNHDAAVLHNHAPDLETAVVGALIAHTGYDLC
jgi:hypothetical protein